MISLNRLNRLEQQEFITTLSGIFEHAPWVPQKAWQSRPFESLQALHGCMTDIVDNASLEQRHILICNHPELAGRQAEQGDLTTESQNEQSSAGLNHCSADELAQLRELNKKYREKFGFPFVIAVKRLTRHEILDAISQRIHNDPDSEFETCLNEIGQIARFRLNELVTES